VEKETRMITEMDSMMSGLNRIAGQLNQPGQQGLYLAFGALILLIGGMVALWRKVNSQAERLDNQTAQLNSQLQALPEIEASSLGSGQGRVVLYERVMQRVFKDEIHGELGVLSWMNRFSIVKDEEALKFLSDRVGREEPQRANLLKIVDLSNKA